MDNDFKDYGDELNNKEAYKARVRAARDVHRARAGESLTKKVSGPRLAGFLDKVLDVEPLSPNAFPDVAKQYRLWFSALSERGLNDRQAKRVLSLLYGSQRATTFSRKTCWLSHGVDFFAPDTEDLVRRGVLGREGSAYYLAEDFIEEAGKKVMQDSLELS